LLEVQFNKSNSVHVLVKHLVRKCNFIPAHSLSRKAYAIQHPCSLAICPTAEAAMQKSMEKGQNKLLSLRPVLGKMEVSSEKIPAITFYLHFSSASKED
jgi:hypothetical protein